MTVGFSDPSSKASKSTLKTWRADWLPIGALLDSDVVYNLDGDAMTNADGDFYYGVILYRQTLPNSAWTQSMQTVSGLPAAQRKAAMGDHWPVIGYCNNQDFNHQGPACIDSDQQAIRSQNAPSASDGWPTRPAIAAKPLSVRALAY